MIYASMVNHKSQTINNYDTETIHISLASLGKYNLKIIFAGEIHMVSPGGISVLCLFHVPDCLEPIGGQ